MKLTDSAAGRKHQPSVFPQTLRWSSCGAAGPWRLLVPSITSAPDSQKLLLFFSPHLAAAPETALSSLVCSWRNVPNRPSFASPSFPSALQILAISADYQFLIPGSVLQTLAEAELMHRSPECACVCVCVRLCVMGCFPLLCHGDAGLTACSGRHLAHSPC